jgi:hypothetical protein
MNYCESCRTDRGYAPSMMKTQGPCDHCGREGTCHHVPDREFHGGRDFHVTVDVAGINEQYIAIFHKLNKIEGELRVMTQEMQRLVEAVHKQETVTEGAIKLITGLSERIKANADDAGAMNALAEELSGKADELAIAVAANTVAETTPGGAPGGTDGGTGSAPAEQ